MLLDFGSTRNLFFTGKGGVGKTTVACATAVQLADAGRKVLLISTDPASNLDEVLKVNIGPRPTPVPSVPNLCAVNLDPEEAAGEYRERMVAPYRGLLPASAIASMEEQFSGSCTIEIAAFDQFAQLLGDSTATQTFDHVIFDTAPTGHTLRLLSLPNAWSGYLSQNTTGTSCLGPLAGLQAQQELYRHTVRALSDPKVTTLVLVTRPEQSACREAARTSVELARLGIPNQRLVINGLFQASADNDHFALAMQRRGEAALQTLPTELTGLVRTEILLSAQPLIGIDSLRAFGSNHRSNQLEIAALDDLPTNVAGYSALHLSQLIEELAAAGRGVIMTMGKGGVGKTTIAATVALALAKRGHCVHLSTTDPAAHLTQTFSGELVANLSIDRIDPLVEVASYRAEVMATAGRDLDEHGRALLEEDLRSPCTEEIAVFRAFAAAVAEGENKFVVLDTAPTGHTILLLDSALAYHREVTRQSTHMPTAVEQLLPRLRDSHFTKVLIVTLPEATPVHEAAALQRDLRRAAIEPFAWIVNQSLTPLSITDATLWQRRRSEQAYLSEIAGEHSQRMVIVAWDPEPPIGRLGLNRLAEA